MSKKYVCVELRAKQKVFVEINDIEDDRIALDTAIDIAMDRFGEKNLEFLDIADGAVMPEDEYDIDLERRTSQVKYKNDQSNI